MKLRSLSYKLKVVVVCVAHDQDQRHTVAAVLTNTHQLPPQWCQVSLVLCHPAQGLLLVALGSLPKFCLDVTELQGERKRKIKVQLIHQNWATQPICIRLFYLERNGFTHYSYVKTWSSLWTIHTGTYYLARHTPLLDSFSLYIWNSVWFIARLLATLYTNTPVFLHSLTFSPLFLMFFFCPLIWGSHTSHVIISIDIWHRLYLSLTTPTMWD